MAFRYEHIDTLLPTIRAHSHQPTGETRNIKIAVSINYCYYTISEHASIIQQQRSSHRQWKSQTTLHNMIREVKLTEVGGGAHTHCALSWSFGQLRMLESIDPTVYVRSVYQDFDRVMSGCAEEIPACSVDRERKAWLVMIGGNYGYSYVH